MKGIILAGGTGSRLWPNTLAVSKQLLPVYDKPLIYYPLGTLMLAGIRDILIITTPADQSAFKLVLGDGSNYGINIEYAIQERPDGLAQAFIIGETFIENQPCSLILGDNLFYGVGLGSELVKTYSGSGAHIFTYEVSDPTQYGILTVDSGGIPLEIIEKPRESKSRLAVTGLYFFDGDVAEIARGVKRSPRGELEITSVISHYLDQDSLTFTALSRGAVWLDTGNPAALNDAANFIRVIEDRTGQKIACLEEIALKNGWINENQIIHSAGFFKMNDYGKYLMRLIS